MRVLRDLDPPSRWDIAIGCLAIGFVLGVSVAHASDVPLRDDCAREAVGTWPFIAEYDPPTDRPYTLREIEARSFLALCRWAERYPHLVPEEAGENGLQAQRRVP